MEIQGKIINVLPLKGGKSQRTGNEWEAQSFVIETQERYPKRMVFDVFGSDKLKEFNIQMGDELVVLFDIDAREWNGRWYNEVRAWKVQRAAATTAQQPIVPPVAQATQSELPF